MSIKQSPFCFVV